MASDVDLLDICVGALVKIAKLRCSSACAKRQAVQPESPSCPVCLARAAIALVDEA